MSATPASYFPGVTIELALSDLVKRVNGVDTPVVTDSGAVVTIVVTDLAGTEIGSPGTATATDDDWYLMVDTPEMPGTYQFKATVTLDAITGRFSDRFDVTPF